MRCVYQFRHSPLIVSFIIILNLVIFAALLPMKNIFQDLPINLTSEVFEVLAQSETTTIERIISQGHSTPNGDWYDQERHEWVMVLQGEAVLSFADGTSTRMTAGDYVNIPAHHKHRVEWTHPNQPTIWLAIHY